MLKRFLAARILLPSARGFATDDCGTGGKKGLVLGVYDGCNPGEFKFTASSEKFNEELNGKLKELLKGANIKKGLAQVYMNLHADYDCIAVSGVGRTTASFNDFEFLDECKENIRIAAGVGTKVLQDKGVSNIFVEGFTNPESAAEGASLASFKYQEFRNPELQDTKPKLDLFEHPDREGWTRGIIKGRSQNYTRQAEETPANLMTPTHFAQRCIDVLCPCGVQVDVRDKDWIESKKMHPLLQISKTSCETPLFLELGYCAGAPNDRPVVLIAKGYTFDSGGLNLRKCPGMDLRRADMAGAAVLMGVLRCIAQMNLPINVRALVPLCENMTGGLSLKPGDVIMGSTGKSIRLDDMRHQGRVILADTIAYSAYLQPCLILNVANLTSAADGATGMGPTPFFTTSNIVWKEMRRAGGETGDRVWRFPFWKHYMKKLKEYLAIDINNVGKGDGGALCKAACFLLDFVPNCDFGHFDISGTGMKSNGIGYPYLRKDLFTGRPVRTVAQFLYQMACPHEKGDEC